MSRRTEARNRLLQGDRDGHGNSEPGAMHKFATCIVKAWLNLLLAPYTPETRAELKQEKSLLRLLSVLVICLLLGLLFEVLRSWLKSI